MGEVIPLKSVLENLASGMSSSSASYVCPKCGRVVEPLVLSVLGRTLNIRRTCECELNKYRQQEEARTQAERRARIQRLFDLAELGPRFRGCTFASWIPRHGTEACHEAAKQYAEHFDEYAVNGQGLLMFGPPGNGKTHLAAAIVHYLIEQDKSCVFRSVPALLKRLQESYRHDARVSEAEILAVLQDADLLVMDDFGAEKMTESRPGVTSWTEATLYYIIDERYRWKKPVIVTTNCELDAFQERIGLRTFDRLLEMCTIVRNSVSSYRQELARARRGTQNV